MHNFCSTFNQNVKVKAVKSSFAEGGEVYMNNEILVRFKTAILDVDIVKKQV